MSFKEWKEMLGKEIISYACKLDPEKLKNFLQEPCCKNQPINGPFYVELLRQVMGFQDSLYDQVLTEFIEFDAGDNLQKKMLAAVMKGDVQRVKSLFEQGITIEDSDWNFESFKLPPIYQAVLGGKKSKVEILRLLIENGLNTKIKSKDRGQNLLHIIAQNEDFSEEDLLPEISKILLNSGVPVDEVDQDGWSPLMDACITGNLSLVVLFLTRGADVNLKSFDGSTPLSAALYECRNTEVIKLLIAKGADVNVNTICGGNTALHHVCFLNDCYVLRMLILKGADVKAINDYKKTALSMVLSKASHYDQISMILISEISKLTFENLPVKKTDMDMIHANPKTQKLFEKCLEELNSMAVTKFYQSHSYYSVLRMSKNVQKLSYLVKNQMFVQRFEANLSSFPIYGEYLEMILVEAMEIKEEREVVTLKLTNLLKDLFPNVVVRNLATFLSASDLSFACFSN